MPTLFLLNFSCPIEDIACPSISTSPLSGVSSAASRANSVVLPLPDYPKIV